jgi:hypothetical protein
MRLPYVVTINSCANGYIVSVGCQTFVFQSREQLTQELGRYLEDPQKMIREYSEKYGALEPAVNQVPPQFAQNERRVSAFAESFAEAAGQMPTVGRVSAGDLQFNRTRSIDDRPMMPAGNLR